MAAATGRIADVPDFPVRVLVRRVGIGIARAPGEPSEVIGLGLLIARSDGQAAQSNKADIRATRPAATQRLRAVRGAGCGTGSFTVHS